MAKILLVEDEHELVGVISDWLSAQNYLVDSLENGREALEQLRFNSYDLIIVDWGLPEVSGIEICRNLRSRGNFTPILMLTGRKQIAEKETGFDSGADDYLTKPFDMRELAARVRSLLRRSNPVASNILTVGDLSLEVDNHRVTRGGKEVVLKPQEFAVLEFFMRHPGQVLSADVILNRVWPTDSDTSPENLRFYISKLRGKLDVDGLPSLLKTVHRLGYKLEA